MKMTRILTLAAITLILASCGNTNTTDNSTSSGQDNSSLNIKLTKVKVDVFNDIEKTRALLSQNGIGKLKDWSSDDMGGFYSITDYFMFGQNDAGIQNNLAYYLESDNEQYIRTVKLVLNINSKGETKQALAKFRELTEETFKSLSLQIPDGLINAITDAEIFQASNDIFLTSLKLDKSKIDTWQLIIESK